MASQSLLPPLPKTLVHRVPGPRRPLLQADMRKHIIRRVHRLHDQEATRRVGYRADVTDAARARAEAGVLGVVVVLEGLDPRRRSAGCGVGDPPAEISSTLASGISSGRCDLALRAGLATQD
ncbi:hypothetical protein MBM_05732 [Drepanopeziza brunnea f. sp. 'multigermtubi' MB_m1]|uniref:Uncharacterized protein n=1 Tax=Marssonina brunnea f. sp. multigermtubi (strain MB_m1) TaxID=1072389 RepID=K1X703_MARBU|nr:uncharacterized protein MBM_05732 [Drepanopeziza brunnea f. sp. 'multigermtubi' MB_m1]EKD16438.1 hypothetical protein MBM_05732 [Drepanopeziza brunnea f. sp. 'multigermtubi' MB_m1]